jgi:methionine-rich copper-binding protein CopC
MFSRFFIAVSFLCVFLTPGVEERAWPHAYPSSSTPADGATVGASPGEVVIRFTEAVEIEFSRIEVKNAGGETVSLGKVRRLAPETLAAEIKALAPGTYRVSWQVLSVDTHVTEGSFRFTVGPPRK